MCRVFAGSLKLRCYYSLSEAKQRMSRLMFVYLSGTEKGKTRIFTQNHVTIGTSDTSDLKLVPEDGGSLPNAVLADTSNDATISPLVPPGDRTGLEIPVTGGALK